jgi:hypothetical protein
MVLQEWDDPVRYCGFFGCTLVRAYSSTVCSVHMLSGRCPRFSLGVTVLALTIVVLYRKVGFLGVDVCLKVGGFFSFFAFLLSTYHDASQSTYSIV